MNVAKNFKNTYFYRTRLVIASESTTWLTIDQTEATSPTEINLIGEYINSEKIDIDLEQRQPYDISINFLAFFRLVSSFK